MIELLIAITIISILAALLVGVAARAGEVARDARTRSLIGRIHTLVIERYDLYRTRRVELNTADVLPSSGTADWRDNFNTVAFHGLTGPGNAIQYNAAGRLAAQRELMKFEMPDRWSDILGGPFSGSLNAPLSESPQVPKFVNASIPLRDRYLRELSRIGARDNDRTGARNTLGEILTNQSAECLYLMVMNATGDGEAPSLFNEGDIGDTDGDGAPEFLDGWGQPIQFLRWAPGFDSDAQWSIPSLQRRYDRPPADRNLSSAEAVRDAIFEDHDPLDVFRLDNPAPDLSPFNAATDALTVRGWRLVPLVLSVGSDGEAGIELGAANYAAVANPYADADPSTNLPNIERLGEVVGDPEDYADNLHNHDVASLSTRR